MVELWPNQLEALDFIGNHHSAMLDMDMGTGKTLVAIRTIIKLERTPVLIVCPKSVMPVWLREFEKHGPYTCNPQIWSAIGNKTVNEKAENMLRFIKDGYAWDVKICIVNYDIVWRDSMRNAVMYMRPQVVVLDESHRIKAAGTKVSRFMALLGKYVHYKMCLSGTPMANSPLDVYGQYRFLNPDIFGTRFDTFRDYYAIMGGPERNFVVGYKNQDQLMCKFRSIAYSCKLSDIADRLKLPEKLPHQTIDVYIPHKDMLMSRRLAKEFIAEDKKSGGVVVLKNVLTKLLRLQQISSGFVMEQTGPLGEEFLSELNTAKEDALYELLQDMPPNARAIVFVVFKHDIQASIRAVTKAKRNVFQLSGEANELDEWDKHGGVLIIQIQAGSEGIDLTKAHHAVYFSLPTSLGLYEQSMARLHRPGQEIPVTFTHLTAKGTIDEDLLSSLENKRSLFDDFSKGNRNYGFLK